MRAIDLITTILVIVGALNWGLVGLFNFNLVQALLGTGVLASAVYVLVGIAAVWQIAQWSAMHRRWLNPAPARFA